MQTSAESAIQLALTQLVSRKSIALSALIFFDFHNPGALPQALM